MIKHQSQLNDQIVLFLTILFNTNIQFNISHLFVLSLNLTYRQDPPGGTTLVWLVLWHINHCRLFNAKSSLYIYIKYI